MPSGSANDRITQCARWALGISIALGVVLRVALLEHRPIHHDESIHATFSYQWHESPSRSYYKYDPTYHGPFLYSVTRWLFPLFGVGLGQARLFPLIFGLLATFSPLLFRRWLGIMGAWAAVGLLAVSPLFVYYARFLAHDMPSVLFGAMAVAFLLQYVDRFRCADGDQARRALGMAAVALGLLYSIKAVSFIYTFIYLTFGLYAWCSEGLPKLVPRERREEVGRHWFLASALFFFAYAVFQTSFFHHPDGFLDGLYRKVIPYWWGQHSIERVAGPTFFHLRSLVLHELPLVLITGVGMIQLLWRFRGGKAWLAGLGLLGLLTIPSPWAVSSILSPEAAKVLASVKVRQSPDIFLFVLCFVFGILGSYQAFREKNRVLAFLIYWSFSTLAIYSYVGEKVPWLTTHVVYPVALLSAFFVVGWVKSWPQLEVLWRRGAVGLAMLAVIYQLRLSYFVTFVTDGEPTDLLSQVHNTRDVRFVVDWMRRVSLETGERPEGIPIAIVGTPTWAFYFHLIEHGFKRFVLDAKSVNGTQRFVITDEASSKELGSKLESWGYRVSKLNHSGWWVPEHNQVSWEDWVSYGLWRKHAGNTGITPMYIYFKPLDTPSPAAAGADSRSVATPVLEKRPSTQ